MTSALSCIICHDSDQALRFFHAPNNTKRLKEWSNLLNLEVKTSSIVCEKHFLDEHFAKNPELKCWRLNKRAIPTLRLTEETFGVFKLINEDDFDKIQQGCNVSKSGFNNVGTQTIKSQDMGPITLVCLWCDDCFYSPDLCEVLMHFRKKHRYEIECFLSSEDDHIFKNNFSDTEEETMDFKVEISVETEQQNCDYDELEEELDQINENKSIKSSEHADDSQDSHEIACFEIEECNVENELVTNPSPIDDDGNLDEFLDIAGEQPENEPLSKMLQDPEEANNQINIETSEPSLIFFIIEQLRANPTIWFINGFKSKEYETGLINFSQQFSEKYQLFTTQMQLHESLIDIRDWYQSTYAQKAFDQLKYPQNEYFAQLAEFLPEKLDGKTCELCAVVFNDHIQYFAHKKLNHAQVWEQNINANTEHLALESLILQVNAYYYARYPLRQGGFSYACQVCSQKYYRAAKRKFLDHIKKHLNIRDIVCDICGKAFLKNERFQVHRDRHFGLHKSKCGICGKEFTNFSLLTTHRKRYHRPIEGTIEEIEQLQRQRKLNKSQIYYMERIEGDQIVFGCPFCEKSYKRKNAVHKHCKQNHNYQVMLKTRPRKRDKVEKMNTERAEQSSDTEIDM